MAARMQYQQSIKETLHPYGSRVLSEKGLPGLNTSCVLFDQPLAILPFPPPPKKLQTYEERYSVFIPQSSRVRSNAAALYFLQARTKAFYFILFLLQRRQEVMKRPRNYSLRRKTEGKKERGRMIRNNRGELVIIFIFLFLCLYIRVYMRTTASFQIQWIPRSRNIRKGYLNFSDGWL